MPKTKKSVVVTPRIPARSNRPVERAARQQSLLVSSRASECEALEFVDSAADTEGWK